MAIDSRAKGQRAEYQVRDLLRKQTELQWERVPGSGGFNVSHGLKGDLYVPDEAYTIKHCIEVKHYQDDVVNSNLFNVSVSQLERFWLQTVREAGQLGKEPLLIFKKTRGKWLVGTLEPVEAPVELVLTTEAMEDTIYIYLFSVWLEQQTAKTLTIQENN